MLLGAVTALPSRSAVAGSRSALVFVSVRVVASCRVDAVANETGKGVDLKMLCNSSAKPAVGLQGATSAAGQSPIQMSTTVTGVRAVSTASFSPSAGEILHIDF